MRQSVHRDGSLSTFWTFPPNNRTSKRKPEDRHWPLHSMPRARPRKPWKAFAEAKALNTQLNALPAGDPGRKEIVAKITITAKFVNARLKGIVEDEDLSRYIL